MDTSPKFYCIMCHDEVRADTVVTTREGDMDHLDEELIHTGNCDSCGTQEVYQL